jgi:alpha-tubulin suppressor-like RCC1 family protein
VLVLGASLAGSCRTPTDITLRITTNIPCSDIGSTTITVGRPGELETAAVTTGTATCDNGTIGTLVVVPSGSDDDAVGMKIVSGYQRRAEQCTPPDYKGCVVARRALRYVSHRELTVLVEMARDCVDVPCTPDETCVGARCVPDFIDDPTRCETPAGCGQDALDGSAAADGPAGGEDGGDGSATSDGPGPDVVVTSDGGPCSGTVGCVGRTIADCVGGNLVPRADGPCAVACSNGACVTVHAIAVGRKHSCATMSDGTIRCWGDGTSGQLGSPSAPNPSPSPVVAAAQIPAATGNVVVAGGDVTCNVRPSGAIDCWGINDHGQLATAAVPWSADPLPIPGIAIPPPTPSGAPALAIGGGHACAANSDGGILCWGDDSSSQLGMDAASPVLVPTRVNGVAGPSVAAGRAHSCAVDTASGNAYCWGDNTYNQIAKGSGKEGGNYAAPQALQFINSAHLVFSGPDHACAMFGNKSVDCWGLDTSGQCGTNFVQPDDPVPTGIKGVSAICPLALAMGTEHTCMMNDLACAGRAGEIDCAGANDAGQLGRGNTVDDPSFGPVSLGALGKAVWLGVGGQHACVVLDTGGAACWGANDRGQLGRGVAGGAFSTPALVSF